MSDNNNTWNNTNNSNYTWSSQPEYSEGQSSRYYYTSSSVPRRGGTYHTTSGIMTMTTPQEAVHDQGSDVQAHAGSFDGDTQSHGLPEDDNAGNEQTHDFENHQQYTTQYIDNLEAPVGYRDNTGDEPSSPRRRAHRRVRPVLDVDYTGQGGSSSSGPASGGQGSSRQHSKSSGHHHGHKSSKHSGRHSKKHGKH